MAGRPNPKLLKQIDELIKKTEQVKPRVPRLQNPFVKAASKKCFNKNPFKVTKADFINFAMVYEAESKAGRITEEDEKATTELVKMVKRHWPHFFKKS